MFAVGCKTNRPIFSEQSTSKIDVIFDTDANNELDDQHALAYLLFSGNEFSVRGVTVNATYNGGNIDEQYVEAERVLKLSNLYGKIPLLKGANGSFMDITGKVGSGTFDGAEAVNFIINEARSSKTGRLVLIAVGKLTNIALALQKDPSIASKVRIVWLGSNYPEPGEYNQDNDTASLNYVLNVNVPFEMVTVRYGKPSGTDAVRVTQQEVSQHMPGRGPKVSAPVTGRHKEAFTTFGDYSVNLFQHIQYHGNPPARALFDMAAVAVVKNPAWAATQEIPAPLLVDNKWVSRPTNQRKIIVWENFKRDEILADFYQTMDKYVLAGTK
jgi:inosine-uridine nucleoside N-ribohydrolase